MQYLRKNWLSILGLVVGVLGVVLSYYFYRLSLQQREPTIVETKNLAIFASLKGLKSEKWAFVTKPDNKAITKNVYIHELAIWNKGRLGIKKENIFKPITITFGDDAEIIEAFIFESTRPSIVNGNVVVEGNSARLNFNILEQGDGIKVRTLYAASDKQAAAVDADIEGVPRLYIIDDLESENILLGVGKLLLIILACLLALLIYGLLYVGYERATSMLGVEAKAKLKRTTDIIFAVIFLSAIAGLVIMSVSNTVVKFAREEAIGSMPKMEHAEPAP